MYIIKYSANPLIELISSGSAFIMQHRHYVALAIIVILANITGKTQQGVAETNMCTFAPTFITDCSSTK